MFSPSTQHPAAQRGSLRWLARSLNLRRGQKRVKGGQCAIQGEDTGFHSWNCCRDGDQRHPCWAPVARGASRGESARRISEGNLKQLRPGLFCSRADIQVFSARGRAKLNRRSTPGRAGTAGRMGLYTRRTSSKGPCTIWSRVNAQQEGGAGQDGITLHSLLNCRRGVGLGLSLKQSPTAKMPTRQRFRQDDYAANGATAPIARSGAERRSVLFGHRDGVISTQHGAIGHRDGTRTRNFWARSM